jgi:S1-C subfamily serine protease
MTHSVRCGFCGASLPGVGSACPECKKAIAPVSFRTGGVLARLAAGLVDVFVLCSLIAVLTDIHLGWWSLPAAGIVALETGYRLHGSLGKSLFGLSVRFNSRTRYYLRETIGKLASLTIFGIGFLLIFSKEGLALHDLIADTCVVPVKRSSPSVQGIRVLLLIISVAAVAYFSAKLGTSRQPAEAKVQPQRKGLEAVTQQVPAVLTIYCYNASGKLVSQGSGFLISEDGVGVTNFHVIREAYRAEAELGDTRLYQVLSIRAFDQKKDIVVLQLGRQMGNRIEWPTGLPYLTLGSSAAISVGDRVATVSSPEGFANTVTDGLVSAIRTEGNRDLIQISAPVSPGSSGSPVFDLNGKVVAVTVAQYAEGQNLNFAIPVETVSELLKQEDKIGFEQFRILAAIRDNRPHAVTDLPTEASRVPTPAPKALVVTGLYSGTVHNQTSDISANFVLLVRENEGLLAGCVGVQQPLYGSGPLQGTVQGSRVVFDVNRADFTISFDGTVHSKQISGSYLVSGRDGSNQEGEFYVERLRAKVPALSGQCPTDEEMNSK